MKGFGNWQEQKSTKSRETLMKELKKAGVKGLKFTDIRKKTRLSPRTIYKQLGKLENLGKIEKIEEKSKKRWRIPVSYSFKKGGGKKQVVELLENLEVRLIHKPKGIKHDYVVNKGLPFEDLYEAPLEWVEEKLSKLSGQPETLVLFPDHWEGQAVGGMCEQLWLCDIPEFSQALIYKLITLNAKVKHLPPFPSEETEEEKRMQWLKQALDFKFLLSISFDGHKLISQLNLPEKTLTKTKAERLTTGP